MSWQLSEHLLLLHPISIPHLKSQALGGQYVFFSREHFLVDLFVFLSCLDPPAWTQPTFCRSRNQQNHRPHNGKPGSRTTFLLGCVSLKICLCVYVFLCSSYAPTPAWLDPPSFCRSSNQQDHGPLTPSASLSSRTLPLFFYL